MDLPNLRHFSNSGIYFVSSDPVEALVGEAWVPAIYTDKGWATVDGASLLLGVEEWRDGQKEDSSTKESGSSDEGIQSRNPTKRQARSRQRAKSQEP